MVFLWFSHRNTFWLTPTPERQERPSGPMLSWRNIPWVPVGALCIGGTPGFHGHIVYIYIYYKNNNKTNNNNDNTTKNNNNSNNNNIYIHCIYIYNLYHHLWYMQQYQDVHHHYHDIRFCSRHPNQQVSASRITKESLLRHLWLGIHMQWHATWLTSKWTWAFWKRWAFSQFRVYPQMEDGHISAPIIPNVWSFDKELKQEFFAFISHLMWDKRNQRTLHFLDS